MDIRRAVMSKKIKAWSRVEIARMIQRPTTLQYIDKIFEDFIELHGDRVYKDDKAIVAGIAFLEDEPVTVIGMQKGKDLNENIERNLGPLTLKGIEKP